MITLYTDGSAHLADMSGGWAWWVDDDLWDAGYVAPATNQRMEMMAVLYGLNALAWHGQPVKVVSDSAYVINCFQQRWYLKWQQNVDLEGNWRSANGKKVVANTDLWQRLLSVVSTYDQARLPITWQHCRGHGRGGEEDAPYVAGNAKVDKLAGAARKAGVKGEGVKGRGA